jgi:hypothetical protein
MKKLIGHMSVDAGLCWVGDPCYVLGDDASSRVHNWDEFCSKITEMKHHAAPLGDGVGFAISTGYGDGSYPVYIETSDEGSWGERVKSITIDFLGDEEDESCDWDDEDEDEDE